jgi:branched-chain amino acid transport system ATP-binding protein
MTAEAVAPAPRLVCSDVTVRFGGIVALSEVGLEVGPGEIVGLVGPNGAGKSTLFGVLSGLLEPVQGTVALGGEDTTRSSPQQRAMRGLSRTFQHPELFAGLTVRDHLVLAHRAKRARHRVWSDLFTLGSLRPRGAEEETAVGELIALLGLESLADRPAHGLPLGAARIVELGRALAAEPSVLLLDEPSSGLDAAETDQFEAVVRRISDSRDVSVLLVEHDVELVMRMCRRIYVLEFGRLIAVGTPAEVRADPVVRAAYLGEETVPGGGQRPTGDAPVVEVREQALEAIGSTAPAAGLNVDGLCVRYGDAVALTDISFTVEPGEVVAVVGPNGAGKSSLARALSGLVVPSAGRIGMDGTDVTGWSPDAIRRAGVVHLPEGRGVFPSLSVAENLRLAVAGMGTRQVRRDAIDAALEVFPSLAERRRTQAGLLSGGEQQMLSLARALATSPRLVIADEMSLGLAPKLVDVVFEGLDRMRQRGVTVLMVEQYVHRALDVADTCLVLQRGRLVWAGPANRAGSEVLRHYLGEAMPGG